MRLRRLVSGIGAFGLALALCAEPAAARLLLAEDGIAFPHTSQSCFAANSGEMTNICSSTRTLDVILPVDFVGPTTVTIYVIQEHSTPVTCQAYSINPTNGFGVPGTVASSNVNPGQAATLVSTINTFNNSGVAVSCQVPVDSTVRVVKWNAS